MSYRPPVRSSSHEYLWSLVSGDALLCRAAGGIAGIPITVPDEDDRPATERLLRSYFGMYRFEWPDDEPVEFHLGHGDVIRLLRGCGLEVEDLVELRPEAAAATRYPFVPLDWARQWPCEEAWKARKSS